MTADCVITLWHFDAETERTMRTVLKNVSIGFTRGITKSGIKEMGVHSTDTAVIRIPTDKWLEISCGDYVALGECENEFPDRGCAMKVIEIRDNRRGTAPHWRISCGG